MPEDTGLAPSGSRETSVAMLSWQDAAFDPRHNHQLGPEGHMFRACALAISDHHGWSRDFRRLERRWLNALQ